MPFPVLYTIAIEKQSTMAVGWLLTLHAHMCFERKSFNCWSFYFIHSILSYIYSLLPSKAIYPARIIRTGLTLWKITNVIFSIRLSFPFHALLWPQMVRSSIYLENGGKKNHIWEEAVPDERANKILLRKQINQGSV